MTNLAQKTPFQRAMNQFAERKVLDGIHLTGKSLPCSIVKVEGWIVTVKFEVNAAPFTLPNVTVPVASSAYDYLPLQAGDPGNVWASDARLGGLSELGAGAAPLSLAANLSTLVFEPFGKKSYVAPSDPLVRVVQGPNGVTIQTLDGTTTTFVLTKTSITMTRGSSSVTMSDSEIDLNSPTIKLNGKVWDTHQHSGVQTGSGDSGPVV